ncbi:MULTISPECIES: heavy-metal-associated domain-containing protein [Parabacteroides]|uniref:Copper chaperone CopZ n=1 Tax=Parabacteroides chinchillae TaxID=871327 RepID=A0A8G2F1X0_9BACT|nr:MULTISPECIES: heavy metal transport/detoxification protein [Parabacteroides]SEF56147.1 Copper chaperone CopZ [Parabacteroides chinchillae]
MSTLKFKTNAKCGGCVSAIGDKLNKILNPGNWSIDLTKPEKLLIVTTELPATTIIAAVTEAGFKAEQLL